MVPLIRYGTVIQLKSSACRPGRTSSSPASASAIETTSVPKPATTVAHSAHGPGPRAGSIVGAARHNLSPTLYRPACARYSAQAMREVLTTGGGPVSDGTTSCVVCWPAAGRTTS